MLLAPVTLLFFHSFFCRLIDRPRQHAERIRPVGCPIVQRRFLKDPGVLVVACSDTGATPLCPARTSRRRNSSGAREPYGVDAVRYVRFALRMRALNPISENSCTRVLPVESRRCPHRVAKCARRSDTPSSEDLRIVVKTDTAHFVIIYQPDFQAALLVEPDCRGVPIAQIPGGPDWLERVVRLATNRPSLSHPPSAWCSRRRV